MLCPFGASAAATPPTAASAAGPARRHLLSLRQVGDPRSGEDADSVVPAPRLGPVAPGLQDLRGVPGVLLVPDVVQRRVGPHGQVGVLVLQHLQEGRRGSVGDLLGEDLDELRARRRRSGRPPALDGDDQRGGLLLGGSRVGGTVPPVMGRRDRVVGGEVLSCRHDVESKWGGGVDP